MSPMRSMKHEKHVEYISSLVEGHKPSGFTLFLSTPFLSSEVPYLNICRKNIKLYIYKKKF